MREISCEKIANEVAKLCILANKTLPEDVVQALKNAQKQEPWPLAKQTLNEIVCNIGAAKQMSLPVCQDTGMACVFVELGQDVHIVGGGLYEAVNEGVRKGYDEGLLRKSIVGDPLQRLNTKDNTPAQITVQLIKGDAFEITVMPKGFGSENMSRLAMLKPSDGRSGVENFVLETLRLAGANPCPPVVVGVGIGGSFDKVAFLAKHALLRPLNKTNENSYYAQMENELLNKINQQGTGPAGYGGKTTAIGLCIETAPTHIAGLPVAVNISCHVTRRAKISL